MIQPHIIEIIMLSGYEESLTKTRMQVGSVTSPCMGLIIIVLISWEGTPTQIKMRVGSITFHDCGGGGGAHDGSVCVFYVKILKYLYVYFI